MGGQVNPNSVTSFKSYSIEYEWQILKVQDRLSNPKTLCCPEILKSPPGKTPATTWKLEALRPAGEVYNVMLTLTSEKTVWARASIGMKVKYKNLYHQEPQPGNPEYVTNYVSVSPYCTDTQTVQRYLMDQFTGTILKNRFYDYTDGEDLIIHCHIVVNELDNPVHVVKKSVEGSTCMSPRFDLSELMEDARHNDRYTDVTLVAEGKHFKVHKVVLAIQSSFFATRFEERWEKDGSNEIDMLDVPADTMDTILTYMYTGKVVNIDKKACDLLSKADEYHMEGLKIMCEEALVKLTTASTAIDILQLATTHNAQNLKKSCLTFIAKNITEVKKSSAWAAWAEEKPNERTNKDLWFEMMEYIVKSL